MRIHARQVAAADEETTVTSHDHDDEALAAAAVGDLAAFATLYRRHVAAIYAFCHQRLGAREAAEDCTAAVFEKALVALPRYRAGIFRAWLYAIARNVASDEGRRRPHLPLDPDWDRPTADPGPEEHALAADGDREVTRLLAALTTEQREIVELRLAGLRGDEIALVLGKSHGAVRATQFRAYQRLREILASERIAR
jgi:RNA polymerase sigma-70 factor (ECF subfamily)